MEVAPADAGQSGVDDPQRRANARTRLIAIPLQREYINNIVQDTYMLRVSVLKRIIPFMISDESVLYVGYLFYMYLGCSTVLSLCDYFSRHSRVVHLETSDLYLLSLPFHCN